MLRCSDGSYYTGHTDDLENRMAEHQAGAYDGHTSARRPVELVWFQEVPSRDEAFRAEMQIKGWSRAKKEAMIRGDWDAVRAHAAPRTGPDLRQGNVPVSERFPFAMELAGRPRSPDEGPNG
jgi:predicted GIY-YIG superfamily endonuclease